MSQLYFSFSPPGGLPDGEVHLHVEDDQAQQGQNHSDEQFQVLLVDLRFIAYYIQTHFRVNLSSSQENTNTIV